MSGDETYLEAFIDSISTLPHELRRNLELLKVIDRPFSQNVQKLQNAQDAFIASAENAVLSLPCTSKKGILIPQQLSLKGKEAEVEENGDGSAKKNKKKKKKKTNKAVEEETMVETDDTTKDEESAGVDDLMKEPPSKKQKDEDMNDTTNTTTTDAAAAADGAVENKDNARTLSSPSQEERLEVIPTTEELLSFIMEKAAEAAATTSKSSNSSDDLSSLESINNFRKQVLQMTDEKVEIAEQTYDFIHQTVRRLDSDIKDLET